ncbi:MAG: GH3 auxin-responsive promoter family protein [Flavobacteriales bacterium]|nr:GH3 auxin-responsive promoter family protein [Bacteroidota bacterium]MCB9240815.1 GH3 auxin-responsive promoter family protein [Flavobacteriales bacterium]
MIFNSLISWYFKKRIQQVRYGIENPEIVQEELFQELIRQGARTEFGQKHGFDAVRNQDDFRNNVPVQDYESIKPYIMRIMRGEQQVLWPTEIRWFAKSSGTTSDKSKFIPVSFEALDECQFRGARDLLTIYCHNNPETRIFDGKSLMIGGSHELNKLSNDSYYGDLSAVMMNNLPFWVNLLRTPKPEIALMSDWEEKMEMMAQATLNEDVTSISGVPTWTLLLINRLLELKGVTDLREVWPNIELYMHGGVGFDPYRDQFANLIRSNDMNYLESYNASEGFFGIQDSIKATGDLLLMMDYGIYYEFIPLKELENEHPKALTLREVELDTPYALVISTNAGLWRYMVGDTIQFTSLSPFRFRITGRTKLFINAFGEELMIDNAEVALSDACLKTNARIREYTAGPVYLSSKKSGAHEWLIEFEKMPDDLDAFQQELDVTLKSVNSDYEAKRVGDLALGKPRIVVCPDGTFYSWMKVKGKLGGQNKVPRLSNNRKIIEEIKSLTRNTGMVSGSQPSDIQVELPQ